MVLSVDESFRVGADAVVEGERVVGCVEEGAVLVDVKVLAVGELFKSVNVPKCNSIR
jgi:hypothetical protein